MHLSPADDTTPDECQWMTVKKIDSVLSLRAPKTSLYQCFCLLYFFVLFLYSFFIFLWVSNMEDRTNGSVHKHGNKKGVNAFLAFGLWTEQCTWSWTPWLTLSSHVDSLRVLDLQVFSSIPWLAQVSCLDSQPANCPLALLILRPSWWMEMEERHTGERISSTHIFLLCNSLSGVPSSWKKDDNFKNA